MAPLVTWLQLMGVQLYPYLDDVLILGESPHEEEQSILMSLQVHTRAGFIVNLKKSDLTPAQDLDLGAKFQMGLSNVYLPEE